MQTVDGFGLLTKYRKALMGFAALWVLAFHQWALVFPSGPMRTAEAFIKQAGFSGVDIFFFLSGFGLYFSARSRSVGEFYRRRFSRLLIPFLAVGLGRFVTDGWSVWQLLGNVTGVNFYLKSVYSLLWFVPGIATLYLLFPLYYRLFTRTGNKTVFTACALILWLLASMLLAGKMRDDLYGFTNRIPVFLIGCLLGYWSERREGGFGRSVWLLLCLLLALGVYLHYLTTYKDMPLLVINANCFLPNVLTSVAICFLLPEALELLISCKGTAALGRGLGKLLGFFGMFSLELYCVQEWLGGLLTPVLKPHMGPLPLNIMEFTLIMAAGLALYTVQSRVLKRIERRRARAAV